MTITPALGGEGYVDEFDLTGDVAAITDLTIVAATLDHTTINKRAQGRAHGKRMGSMGWMSLFNDAAGQSFPVLSEMPTVDRLMTYNVLGSLGSPAWSMVGQEVSFTPDRAQDGRLTLAVAGQSNRFIEPGRMLTAGLETSTTPEGLTGFTDGAAAATDNGLQAYLHVTAFSGTDCTISIQDSDDDGDTDPYADVAAFTQVTGVGWERIASVGTNVKQYLRAETDGTFTSITFAVMVVPNRLIAPVF